MKFLSQNLNLGRAVTLAIRFVSKWVPPLAAWLDKIAQRYAGHALESYLSGDLDQAVAYYREAIALQPHDADLHSALGQVYYEQVNSEEAERQFRKALDYDYRNLRALKSLGVVLQEKGKPLDAMYLYLKFLEVEPKDAVVCHNLGAVFYNLGNYEKAIEYYERAEKEDPDDPLVHKNHALALLALGRPEEAQDALLEALKLAPQDAEVDRLLGSALDAHGDPARALEYCESALRKDPKSADVHLQFAYLAERLGRHHDGVEHAKAAVDLFRQVGDEDGAAQAYWELGWNYYELGDWTKSLQASTEALKITPNLPPVYFNLGLALLQLGRAAEARKQYEEGIARLVQVTDLKVHGIDDLRVALDKNPNLAGATEILAMLGDKYATRSKELARSADEPAA